MRKTAQQKTPLEREVDYLIAEGYTVIDPAHNAIKAILTELGKADLPPREVEALCQTAKVAGLNGFTRIDQLPCGCQRVYKGMIVGFAYNPQTYALKVGGIEGVKPCPKHTELIEAIKLCITTS
jgi:hypothetical protein